MKPLSILLTIYITFGCAFAQSKDQKAADLRVQNAENVLKLFSALGKDSPAFDLAKRAKAIAIFSDIQMKDLILGKEIKGKGVLVFLEDNRWGLPSFLNCRGMRTELGRGLFTKNKIDAVFLFMNDESFDLISGWWRTKDPKITGNKLALGPVVRGKGADSVSDNAAVIYYTFDDNKVAGEEFLNDRFSNALRLSHDKGLNKSVYGKSFKPAPKADVAEKELPASMLKFRDLINTAFEKGK